MTIAYKDKVFSRLPAQPEPAWNLNKEKQRGEGLTTEDWLRLNGLGFAKWTEPTYDKATQKLGTVVFSQDVEGVETATYEVVSKTAQEVTDYLNKEKIKYCQEIDAAAVALDSRITTVGGHQSLEYHLRAEQLKEWDAASNPDIDEIEATKNYTILGQSYTVPIDPVNDPPKYKWGLVRCYVKGFIAEFGGAQADALEKMRYERDLWLYLLDLRADGRLGEFGKAAVRKATTVSEAKAARDVAVSFLNSIS